MGAVCVEDAPLLQWGTRLTAVWTEFGDGSQIDGPLGRLAGETLGQPDLVVVSVGAWWMW